MEPPKEKSPKSVVSSRSKLRYPLRSASKPKDEKSATAETKIPFSASKRDKNVSSVSKSVSVLDFSGKEKSLKLPRRLSVPSKSPAGAALRSTVGNITPIPENKGRRLAMSNEKGDTPASDASRSIIRRKFSVLSSTSYWLSQIKLSESASKHSISLGFFKLALEAGCEPLNKLKDELKRYARRHHILDLGEPAKEVLRSYNILEEVEQSQMSETSSLVHEDDDSSSEVTIGRHGSMKPMAVNSENSASSVTQGVEVRKPGIQRRNNASLSRASVTRSSVNLASVNNSVKNSKRPEKPEVTGDKAKAKNLQKEANEKGPADPPGSEEVHEDKENVVVESHSLEEAQAVA
ncbi:uncharacterized protein LOC116267646 [Nymphaea colorata]|nr:uncharacterized protein LOC116267646 [Nymphaea colorata]